MLQAALPALYAPWLRAICGGSPPAETKATCDHCAMVQPDISAPGASYFYPDTKCCTFQPTVPNFLAGQILSESDLSISEGRQALEDRIVRRVGVRPSGVAREVAFEVLYGRASQHLGRARSFRCHYLTKESNCGIWKYRPGVCATWYCKHVRGAVGFRFWKLTDRLLREVESDLSYWCLAELGAGASELSALPERSGIQASDLGGDVNADVYRQLWGRWQDLEVELYIACGKLVQTLAWSEV